MPDVPPGDDPHGGTQPPDDPSPDRSPPEPSSADPAGPPRALIDGRIVEDFAVPSFVGDGPSRRTVAPIATLMEAPTPDPASAGGGIESEPRPPDDPTQAAFERAAERALRSRHVSEIERPFVRLYFDRLRERIR
jgi:hypothetical protein